MDQPPLSYLQRRRQVEARIRAVRENQPTRSSEEAYAQMARMKASECGETLLAAPAVDWTQSAAFRRDRSGERILSAAESLALTKDAGGRY